MRLVDDIAQLARYENGVGDKENVKWTNIHAACLISRFS